MAMFLRFAGLVLVAGLLLVFQFPNYAHAVQKEENDDGISRTTGVGKIMGGRKMVKEWNTETTGLSEVNEEDEKVNEEEEEEGSPLMSRYRDEEGSQVRLLEEVMQLMRKDYKGMPRPRRKPPIQD